MASTPINLTALALAAIERLDFSKSGWQAAMEKIIARSHTAAALAALAERGGKIRSFFAKFVGIHALPRAEQKTIKTAVQKQLDYLKGFVADAGGMSEAAIKARAALYAGAVRNTFSQIRSPGLPFHPADGGTPCKMNCKCSWEQDGDNYIWTLHPAEHCDGCLRRAAGNPYKVS